MNKQFDDKEYMKELTMKLITEHLSACESGC